MFRKMLLRRVFERNVLCFGFYFPPHLSCSDSLYALSFQLLSSDEKDIFAFAGFNSVTRTKTPAPDSASLSGFPSVHKQLHKKVMAEAAQKGASKMYGGKHKRENANSSNGIDFQNPLDRDSIFQLLKNSR